MNDFDGYFCDDPKKVDISFSPYTDSVPELVNMVGPARLLKEGFVYCKNGNVLSSRSDDFKDKIRKTATSFYSSNKKDPIFHAMIDVSPSCRIAIFTSVGYASVGWTMMCNSSNEDLFDFIEKHNEFFNSRDDKEISVNYFSIGNNGLASTCMYVPVDSLDGIYPELYPDIDIDVLLDAYIKSPESILMLYGIPGVGKTTFIKYLLASGKFEKIVYIKDPKVMAMGALWSKLTMETYDLVIFDDLDAGLAPRDKTSPETSHFMTQLLSFSDGIFQANKTKIIITTNQDIEEIDGALVRPGRCFDFLNLNPLSIEDARSAWVDVLKLNEERFHKLFGGRDTVTQASLMSEAVMMKSVTTRSYLKSGDRDYTLEQKLDSLNIKVRNVRGIQDNLGFN